MIMLKHTLKPILKQIFRGIYAPDYKICISGVQSTIYEIFGFKEDGKSSLLKNVRFKKVLNQNKVLESDLQVFMLIDTVGFSQFRWNFPLLSHLHESFGGILLSSVFPTVTSVAITSIYTGVYPAKHGILGHKIFFREIGNIVNTLTYSVSKGYDSLYRAGVDPDALLWASRLSDGKELNVVELSHAHILNSGLSRFLYRDVRYMGYETIVDGFSKLEYLIRKFRDSGKTLINFYLGDFDALGHSYGCSSVEYRMQAEFFERAFRSLILRLQDVDNVAFTFVSDHGQQYNHDKIILEKDFIDSLKSQQSISIGRSGRVLHIYTNGENEQVEEELNSKVSGKGYILSFKDLVRKGLLGKVERGRLSEIRARIGDYVLIPNTNIEPEIRGDQREEGLQVKFEGSSTHGGLSKDELLVPWFSASLKEIKRVAESISNARME